jgi:hypothetical protein
MAAALDQDSEDFPKQTAGEKIKAFYDKVDGYRYEAGEILECLFKDLEKIILNIRQQNILVPEYYIVTQSDYVPWMGNALHLRTWWRKTRPTPQAKQDCYKVTNPGDLMEVQWSIPFPQNCASICANPKAYDPQLAQWVISFVKGTLS